MNIRNSQAGAILPLLAVAIVAIIGLVALMVDLSRGTYSVNTIQEATDSASLSAVRQLNGTQEGWDNALSAALLALQSNPISGAPADALNGLVLNTDGPLGDSTVGEQNGIRVAVARGVYWFDDSTNSSQFVSLEDGATRGKGPWLHKDYAKHVFADAVRVELNLEQLQTSGFARVQGVEAMRNLNKSSIAMSDNRLQLPVFPGGIPYCQLMLNPDPNETEEHLLENYNPSISSSRELYFTELEGFVTGTNDDDSGLPTASQERREGLRRYLSHVYMPTYDLNGSNLCSNKTSGTGVSCKHTPIQALLGINGNSAGETTVADLKDHFEFANIGSMRVSLGQHFNPLREYSGDVSGLTEKMQEFFEGGSGDEVKTIEDFIDSSGTRKYAKSNFPAVRHKQENDGSLDFMKRPRRYFGSATSDLKASNRINWPLDLAGQEYRFGLLLGLDRSPGQQTPKNGVTYAPFVNPMCNSATENLDKTNYRVRKVNVMVISPGSDESVYNGEQVTYCDFEHQFVGEEQDSRVPWWKNEPRIVGVVPVDFIGFNFEDLTSMFPAPVNGTSTPVYQSTESGGLTIQDNNPGFLELGAVFKSEIEQFETEYNECTAGGVDPDECEISVSPVVSLPAEISSCFDDSAYVVFKNQVSNVSSTASSCQSKGNQCNGISNQCQNKLTQCNGIDPTADPAGHANCMAQYSACMANLSGCNAQYGACISNLNLQIVIMSYSNFIFNIPARADKHCLPLPQVDAYNFNQSSSYEQPLHELSAGRGCGGVRAKVANEGSAPLMLNTGRTWAQMTPTLAENGS